MMLATIASPAAAPSARIAPFVRLFGRFLRERGLPVTQQREAVAEVVFVETLRRYVRDLPVEQTGWLAGARDPIVGKSLTLMHRRPDHAWTISELAGDVGVSRSVLADRFGKLLGEPPITYLTRWRLRLGAHALTTTSQSVAEIAGTVGYESEAAFNRAFKREFSLPPARYRQTERSRRRPPAVEARDAQHV
jgi:transcriptional regulator GlxA family with amidase domain